MAAAEEPAEKRQKTDGAGRKVWVCTRLSYPDSYKAGPDWAAATTEHVYDSLEKAEAWRLECMRDFIAEWTAPEGTRPDEEESEDVDAIPDAEVQTVFEQRNVGEYVPRRIEFVVRAHEVE